jgi:hypothetical protein
MQELELLLEGREPQAMLGLEDMAVQAQAQVELLGCLATTITLTAVLVFTTTGIAETM